MGQTVTKNEEQQEIVVEALRELVKDALSPEAIQSFIEDPLKLNGLFSFLIFWQEGHLPFEPIELFEEQTGENEQVRQKAFAKIAEGFADLANITITKNCKGLEQTVNVLDERGELN
jgi:hypothetical protein